MASSQQQGYILLFTFAYPRVLGVVTSHYDFTVPSISIWRAIAEVVTLLHVLITLSSVIFSIVLGVWAVTGPHRANIPRRRV